MNSDFTLIHGDCLEEMKKIQDGSIDFCLTDPPYGTTACKWDQAIPFEPMWEQLHRIVKPNGAIALFGSEPFSSALRMSNIGNFKYDWYWDKLQGGNHLNSKIMPLTQIENVCVFSLNKLTKIRYYPILENKQEHKIRPQGKRNPIGHSTTRPHKGILSENYDNTKSYPVNIIKMSSKSKECNSLNRLHPTQKPVDLLEYLIKTYTLEWETVLDFTMGSGSTAVACYNTNRKFIGIEKDETYFKIAEKRIAEAQGKTGLFA